MATTCKLIAKQTLGADAAAIEFTSIPGTYTDLLIVASLRSTRSATVDTVLLRFNGATTDTNHSGRYLEGNGATVASGTFTSMLGVMNGATSTSSTFGQVEYYIPNYAGSTTKSISHTGVTETNGTTAYIDATAFLWNDTSAITSVKFVSNNAANFVTGSSMYIFGLTKS